MAVCSFCGTVSEAQSETDDPPITWITSFERDQVRYYCEKCSRENLRSIEGKLDTEYW
ncbi:MAG: hypothetical protein ABWZ26_00995 [Candidatus Nanopelagicales bacterium]